MQFITKEELTVLADLLSKLDKERHTHLNIGMKAHDLRALVVQLLNAASGSRNDRAPGEGCQCHPGRPCSRCQKLY